MYGQRRMEIVIDAEGKVRIDAIGFAGTSCKDATKVIEQALGAVESSQNKPELYQTAGVGQQQRIGGR